MARTQSKLYPEIRDSILKAAAQLFATQGYANTSIVDLTTACDLSRGALYHYFASKEEILFDILKTHLDSVLGAVKEQDSSEAEPLTNLRNIFRCLMALNSQNRAEQITLLNEANQLDLKSRTLISKEQREIVDIILNAIRRHDPQKRMARRFDKVYTMMLLGAINYGYIWFDPEGHITPEEYADMTIDAFIHGFGNPYPTSARRDPVRKPRSRRIS